MQWLTNFGLILQCLMAIMALLLMGIFLIITVSDFVSGHWSWRIGKAKVEKEIHDAHSRLSWVMNIASGTKDLSDQCLIGTPEITAVKELRKERDYYRKLVNEESVPFTSTGEER